MAHTPPPGGDLFGSWADDTAREWSRVRLAIEQVSSWYGADGAVPLKESQVTQAERWGNENVRAWCALWRDGRKRPQTEGRNRQHHGGHLVTRVA